jgi:tRNA (pseudouridine54-N1)-methyltransferase
VRHFVLIGQRATASPDFLLDDLAGTSGRLDVLLRSLRAALLVSHGLRADTIAYLVLLGGPSAPKALRFEGSTARFLRPEERSLATLVKKVLAADVDRSAPPASVGFGFAPARPGIAVASGGLDAVLADLHGAPLYVLEEGAPDVRRAELPLGDAAFVVGDHLGFDDATRATLAAAGASPLGIGPVSVHAEDAVTILANELDRRSAAGREGPSQR